MLTGRCLCQAVRWEIDAALGPVVCCHCVECRRANGSAFATNANVARDGFRLVAGADAVREYESTPGKFRAFCGRCGSPVYSRVAADPSAVRIRLGGLDQDPGVRPVLHVWADEAPPWAPITDDVPRIARG